MCLIAFALNARPGVPLLLAANRDEFFDRPTARLHRWALADGSQVVAGRDLREGGTWLGVASSGRVAMLTNVRSAETPAARLSRGELVTRWLGMGFSDVSRFAQAIDPAAYGGFNLVVGDLKQGCWSFMSNRNPAHPHAAHKPDMWLRSLQPGLYALSNASLNTDWPKTTLLRSALSEALKTAHAPGDAWQQILLDALGSQSGVDPSELPNTGVPLELEQALASPFVHMPERGYGTRSSLVMRAQQNGVHWDLSMDEWRHELDGSPSSRPVWGVSSRRREQLQLVP